VFLVPAIAMGSCSMRGCGGSPGGSSTAQSTAAPVAAPAAADARPSVPPADDTSVADAAAFITRAGATPEPSTFNVDRTAADAGSDPAALFAFVHDRIRTEIYRGVLRGAGGTLMSGAGNAWDQSLLLAAMLRHHGREVRFAHAHLPADAAAKIVDRMFTDAAGPSAKAAPGVDLPDGLRDQGRATFARIQADWQRAHADLLDAIDRAHLTLGGGVVSPQALASESADHLFVQYRDGDQWIALDPAGATAPGASAAPAEETFADVPDSAYHHVTVHVFIETRRDGRLDRQEALRYPATAAELHGHPLLLTHRFEHDLTAQWRATPVLQAGAKFYAARTFNAAGLVAAKAKSKEDLIGQAHDAVGGLGAVTDAFGGGAAPPKPPAAAELTGESLEVEFTDPAKQSVTVRRDLFDRIGVVARANGAAATAPVAALTVAGDTPIQLAGVYACAFASGRLDPALPLRRVKAAAALPPDLQALGRARAAQDGSLAPADRQKLARVLEELPSVLAATAESTIVVSQQLASRLRAGDASTLFYEATPRLVIASFEPTAGAALDLRRAAVRAVSRNATAADLAKASLARSAADAAIESALMATGPRPGSPARRIAAIDVFDRARADGITFVAVRSGEPLTALQPSDFARARMAATEPGRVLIAPARMPSAPARFAWWLLDPSTGDAVTVLDTGLHGAQSMPEYAETNAISPLAYEVPPPGPPPISPMAYEVPAPLGAPGISPLAYNVAAPWAQCVEFTGEMMLELIRALTATGNL